MIKKLYRLIHDMTSRAESRGEYSSGYWHDRVRSEALRLCSGIDGRILEVGCGEGIFLADLMRSKPKSEIWGIDSDGLGLAAAGARLKIGSEGNVKLKLEDARSLSFADGYFDGVFCLNVFLNMDTIDTVGKMLSEMARVCKIGGKLVFDFRNSKNPLIWAKYKLARYYDDTINDLPLKAYSPKEIEAVIKKLNLEIVCRKNIGFTIVRSAPTIMIEARKTC